MKINRNSETYGVFVYIQHFVAMRYRILESLIDITSVNININIEKNDKKQERKIYRLQFSYLFYYIATHNVIDPL